MGEHLVSAFKKHGFTLAADSTTQKLQAIADSLSVEPEWIAAHYEAFMSAREYTKEVQEEDMDAFGEYAKQENKKQSQAKLKLSSPLGTPRPKPTGPRVLGDFTNLQRTPYGATVATPGTTSGRQQRTSTSSTADLSKLGVVTSSLNSHLSFAEAASSEAMDVDNRPLAVTVLGQSADSSPLFMMDRLQDKVNYIEERMMRFAEAVEAVEGCSLDTTLGLASQVARWHVGRICCDSEGQLNANSVLLEGSIRFSQGQRVRLDLSKLASYRIFPGQIVAVEGVNPSGTELVASRLVVSALPSVLRPVAAAGGSQPTPETDAGAPLLSVVVASGPFTKLENLDYEPLEALLHFCLQHKPDLLLLLGPFVDAEHPCIQGGTAQQTFQDIFEEKVIFPLQAAEGVRTVALVPSTRDAHHLPVFPQPALRAEGGGEKVVLLDNPSTFRCRGLTFGVVTADVLRHLSSQEIQRGNPGGDRLAAIASHLIWQQSYYPIFPPAVGTLLDTSLAERLQLPATPDVLLLPSDLNSFAKLLPITDNDSTVCVNPGRLTKGSSRGGFAHIKIADRVTAAAQSDAAACFGKVCRVDITRV